MTGHQRRLGPSAGAGLVPAGPPSRTGPRASPALHSFFSAGAGAPFGADFWPLDSLSFFWLSS